MAKPIARPPRFGVAVERIDYWEPPTSRIVRLVQAVKAVVIGQAVDTPRKTLDGSVPD
jgi:hypothetical protein